MYITKRDGEVVPYERVKIEVAVRKANYELNYPLTEEQVQTVVDNVEERLSEFPTSPKAGHNVEGVQTLVVAEIGKFSKELSLAYFEYKQAKSAERGGESLEKSVLALVQGANEEVQKENSNKDPVLNSTQRDLIAGEVSKDYVRRTVLPRRLVKAHDDGIAHIHDMDYMLQPLTNCELVDLEDMLQNGTVINGNLIETPKSFQTACTIATQISSAVASSTFGGQTMSLAHLSPFIDISRQKILKSMILDYAKIETGTPAETYMPYIRHVAERRLREEVKNGVQTIQYQLETLSSTNGRTGRLHQ